MRSLAISVAAIAFVVAAPVWSDSGAKMAQSASAMLLEAGQSLDAAETSRDRIAALTETVRAYEVGLSAMREGLRRAALRERVLTEKLQGEDQDIGALLALLQAASRQTQSRALMHPGSATQTIRAGQLAAMMVPALHQQAALIDDDLTELAQLIEIQKAGLSLLQDGHKGMRTARLELSEAVASRTDLPPRVSTDDAAMQALVNSAETLSAFADSLATEELAATDGLGRPWPLPVKGELLRGFNEADGAGRRRPGWIIATDPEAILTAPSDATVRFSGEIPGQGTVAILEATGGSLMILAGIGKSFVERDQIVAKNDPIGFMSGNGAPVQENLIGNSEKSSVFGAETLYMEIRQGRAPVDPADLLTLVQE